MITYKKDGDTITLEMTSGDFDTLLVMAGFAAGAARKANEYPAFYAWLEFVNRINRTNPHFTQYEIPEKYRKKGANDATP